MITQFRICLSATSTPEISRLGSEHNPTIYWYTSSNGNSLSLGAQSLAIRCNKSNISRTELHQLGSRGISHITWHQIIITIRSDRAIAPSKIKEKTYRKDFKCIRKVSWWRVRKDTWEIEKVLCWKICSVFLVNQVYHQWEVPDRESLSFWKTLTFS